MISAGGPSNGEGWVSIGSTATRPALSLYEERRPVLVLTCEGTQTRVQVRGLQPKQAWPQPDLALHFGPVTRAMPPGVRNVGEQVAYEIQFRLADEVLGQIAAGAQLSVDFNAQSRTFHPIPELHRRAFAEGCAALVPAGMRQAGQ